MKSINIDDLEKLQQSDQILSFEKRAINFLIAAVNDWPISIDNLNDFEKEINLFIEGEATKNKIKEALSRLDYSKYAWKAESLTQLISLLKLHKSGMTLKDVIFDLTLSLEKVGLV